MTGNHWALELDAMGMLNTYLNQTCIICVRLFPGSKAWAFSGRRLCDAMHSELFEKVRSEVLLSGRFLASDCWTRNCTMTSLEARHAD